MMEQAIEYRQMTPDEAFAIPHGLFENAVANDEADPGSFSRETRVCDLYWIGDDMSFGVSGKARALGPLLGIHAPLREWRKALKPGRKKSVTDLCTFLAQNSLVPMIPAPSLLGQPCRAAGAFLTVRKLLEQTEIDTTDLAPSTALEEYSKVGIPKIWRELIKLAPSLLSGIRCEYHWHLPFILSAILFLFSTVAGGVISAHFPVIGLPGSAVSFLGFVLVWRLSEKHAALPKRLTFDEVTTFRDLCKFICDANSERPGEELSRIN